MLEKVLEVIVVGCWLYLAAKPSHVGADADGLAYFLPGTVLSHRAIVGGGAFLRDVMPPGLDIW
jgi:hypothetical protein